MSDWNRCNRNNPCPICKHKESDGCSIGETHAICIRIESAKPSSIGWLHKLSEDAPRPKLPPKKQNALETKRDASKLIARWESTTRFEWIERLADDLGVSCGSLYDLGCVWANEYNAFAFPMRDWTGRIVGIRLRTMSGRKFAVKNCESGSGLFYNPHLRHSGTAFFTEGPTDTAAGLDLGVFIIGRPSSSSGVENAVKLIDRMQFRRVVILSNNDSNEERYTHEKRNEDGSIEEIIGNPGVDGSKSFQKSIARVPSTIVVMPVKDVREFKKQNGTKLVLENLVNKADWKYPVNEKSET